MLLNISSSTWRYVQFLLILSIQQYSQWIAEFCNKIVCGHIHKRKIVIRFAVFSLGSSATNQVVSIMFLSLTVHLWQ